MRGQARAVESLQQVEPEVWSDYYDVALLRNLHGPSLMALHDAGEVAIYLRMSADGFKLF